MDLPFICKRIICTTFFIFVSWTIAGAYTLVLYGGKRVEIPDNFIVTSDAVIYEVSPNVNVSFRLKSIDVPATERANNDASGSLLGRIGRVQAPPASTVNQKATRTITNRDLEPYERARVSSEASWEKRQKELGLPSLEETRRELARREAALDEFLAMKRFEEERNRREREAKLRAEMAARMNAIDYQSGQNYWPTGIVTVDGGPFGRRGFSFRLRQGSPCGFNASPSCLLTHPFSLFNQSAFPARRATIVAPRTIVRGARGGGIVLPGGRH
jgi:hypothetical protein